MNLKNLIDKVFWIAVDYIGFQFINLVIQIFLARLLSPSDFGILSIIIIFLAIFNVFFEQGIINSMIVNKIEKEEQLSSFYWFSLILGIFFSILLFTMSYPISIFLGNHILVGPIQLISLCLVTNSMLVIYKYQLITELKFKVQAKITMIASIISGLISILMAIFGFEYWSLIFKTIIMNVLMLVFMMKMSTWRPTSHFKLSDLKKYYKASINIVTIAILDVMYSYSLNIVIGRHYSMKTLGYYTNAQKFTQIFSNLLILVTNRLSLAKLPKLSNVKKIEIINKVTLIFTAVLGPLVFFLIFISPKLIYIVLGKHWLYSDNYFKIFIVISMIAILTKSYVSLTEILNETKYLLKIEMFYKLLSIGFAAIMIMLNIDLLKVLIFLLICNFIYFIFYLIKYGERKYNIKISIMFIMFITFCSVYSKFYFKSKFILNIDYGPLILFFFIFICINMLLVKNMIFSIGVKNE